MILGQLSSGCLIQVGCLIEVTTNTGLTVIEIISSAADVFNALRDNTMWTLTSEIGETF